MNWCDDRQELRSYRDKMGEKINGWQVTYDVGRYGTKYGGIGQCAVVDINSAEIAWQESRRIRPQLSLEFIR